MPTILVTDRDKKPIEKAHIFVKWKSGGHSTADTNAAGLADLNCSGGTMEYISVNGETILSAEIYLSDNQVFPVTGKR